MASTLPTKPSLWPLSSTETSSGHLGWFQTHSVAEDELELLMLPVSEALVLQTHVTPADSMPSFGSIFLMETFEENVPTSARYL